MVYWLTGQPGHGKTVIGKLLYEELHKYSDSIHIDGDEVREIFNNKDYSEEGRRKNVGLVHDLVYFLSKKGFNVIVSMISPFREQRESFKEKMGDDMIEIYVHTEEKRGREDFHVKNYEAPLRNFLDIDTTNITPDECVTKIFIYEQQKLRS